MSIVWNCEISFSAKVPFSYQINAVLLNLVKLLFYLKCSQMFCVWVVGLGVVPTLLPDHSCWMMIWYEIVGSVLFQIPFSKMDLGLFTSMTQLVMHFAARGIQSVPKILICIAPRCISDEVCSESVRNSWSNNNIVIFIFLSFLPLWNSYGIPVAEC